MFLVPPQESHVSHVPAVQSEQSKLVGVAVSAKSASSWLTGDSGVASRGDGAPSRLGEAG